MKGSGLLNNLINNLPFEAHLPGYIFCGPGTKLEKRLLRGDKGINKLDEACMQHDIAYTKSNDLKQRHKADLTLLNMAKQRTQAKDASKREKLASWLVSKVMKTKLKKGAGVKTFKSVTNKIRAKLKKTKPKSNCHAIESAYLTTKKYFRSIKCVCLVLFLCRKLEESYLKYLYLLVYQH